MSQTSPTNLHDLLILKVKVLYDVETQLIKALPKMAEASHDSDLKQAFNSHLKETEGQAKRLEEVFKHLNIAPNPETSDAIRGLIADAEWCIDNVSEPNARDASLIAAAQYVEHFEMAGYGSASEWAKLMKHNEVADLLEQTLAEEKTAEEKLNNLALSRINQRANAGSEDEERRSFGGKLETVRY